MLVLSRKTGEEVWLTLTEDLPAGTQLKVMVVDADRKATRLGFEAPKSVRIHRREVEERGTGPASPPEDEGDLPCQFRKEGE